MNFASKSQNLAGVFFLVLNTLLGICVILSSIIFVLVCSPIYLYRWILAHYLVQIASPTYGKAVTVLGHVMAVDFLPSLRDLSPRSCIIASIYLKGSLQVDTLTRAMRKGWLQPDHDGILKYPEFRQYIDQFGGFLFWRNAPKFDLSDHVFCHTIPETVSFEVSQAILTNLVENLMNKPFTARKSPWEVHLLSNFKEKSINEDANMTIAVFRLHHALVDGFSFLHAVVEGLLSQDKPTLSVQEPSKAALGQEKKQGSILERIKRALYGSWRFVHDAGYLVSLQLTYTWKWQTPWHIVDQKKSWKQMVTRSEMIPVEKIKYIKNQLGGYFTGVVLSCIAAGAAEHFKEKGYHGRKLPVGCIVPVKKHPEKLRNNLSGTFMELDVSPDLEPITRLHSIQSCFHDARFFSQIPVITLLATKMIASLPAQLVKILGKNRVTPVGISNFPGPGVAMDFLGHSGLALDFSVGGLQGVCGLTFCVISYNSQIRITITGEKGAVSRTELTNVMNKITNELDKLHELAGTEITVK